MRAGGDNSHQGRQVGERAEEVEVAELGNGDVSVRERGRAAARLRRRRAGDRGAVMNGLKKQHMDLICSPGN